jgi:hypothetical protein
MAVPHPGGTNITTSTTSFIMQWFSMITSVRLGLSAELLFARVPLDRVSCCCVHGALCSVMLPRFGGFIAKRVVLWGSTHCEHSTYGVEATRDTLRGTSTARGRPEEAAMALRKRRREARVGRPKVVCATVRALVFVPRVGSVACVILPQVRLRARVRSQLAYALRKTRLYAALTAPSNPADIHKDRPA